MEWMSTIPQADHNLSHDKINEVAYGPSEDSVQHGPALSLVRVFIVSLYLRPLAIFYAYRKDSDQAGQMPVLRIKRCQ